MPRRRASAGRVKLITGSPDAIWVHEPSDRRVGIERQPRTRTAASLPLTELQQLVLDHVGDDVRRLKEIAAASGLGYSAVSSALYRIADRGLVEHVIAERGWRRVA